MSDPSLTFAHRFMGRAEGGQLGGARLLQADSDTLSVNATTTAIVPVYSTFPLGVSLTTTRASSLIHIYAYVAWALLGAGGGARRTANFRFRLNGVLITGSRATSGDTLDGQIRTNSFSRLLAVSAGVQAVTFEWAKQSGAGTLLCNPPAAPDVFSANLKIEEYAAA